MTGCSRASSSSSLERYFGRTSPLSSSRICSRNAVHVNVGPRKTRESAYPRVESMPRQHLVSGQAFAWAGNGTQLLNSKSDQRGNTIVLVNLQSLKQCEHVGVSREQRNFRFLHETHAGTSSPTATNTSSSPLWWLPVPTE